MVPGWGRHLHKGKHMRMIWEYEDAPFGEAGVRMSFKVRELPGVEPIVIYRQVMNIDTLYESYIDVAVRSFAENAGRDIKEALKSKRGKDKPT